MLQEEKHPALLRLCLVLTFSGPLSLRMDAESMAEIVEIVGRYTIAPTRSHLRALTTLETATQEQNTRTIFTTRAAQRGVAAISTAAVDVPVKG